MKVEDMRVRLSESKQMYCTRANSGCSWIVAAPKNYQIIGAFFKNFVQSHAVKIDKIWENTPMCRAEKNIFWIEAASFIGVGTLCKSMTSTIMPYLRCGSNPQSIGPIQCTNEYHCNLTCSWTTIFENDWSWRDFVSPVILLRKNSMPVLQL